MPPAWPEPLSPELRAQIDNAFLLDPEVTYLNHGSFGACPKSVLAAQRQWQEVAEREPVQFYAGRMRDHLDAARAALAPMLGARPDDLAFVTNATQAVNAIVRSLDLAPGDEIVTTSHDYNACRNALAYVAARTGVVLKVASVPFPLRDEEEVVEAVLTATSPRTRLVLLDHVTSATALVFPVTRLCRALRERGIEVLVDGAHAIGMVPIDLAAMAPTYYTTNCHKWLCAPKGAALLYVAPERQADIHPLAISHGATQLDASRSRFRLEFDWTGTDDASAFLAAPEAMRAVPALIRGSWEEVRQRNHAMACAAQSLLADVFGITPPAPPAMLGAMATLPLAPSAAEQSGTYVFTDPVQAWLYDGCRIEVPIFRWQGQRLLRISAQLYNRPEHYELLLCALSEYEDMGGKAE